MFLALLRTALVIAQLRNSDIENIGQRDINRGLGNFNTTSLEKEIALGRQLAAEFERLVTLLEDPLINEYVNRVGQNLVLHSDAKVPVSIKVVESDEINASALPGGFVYINTGLIAATNSEAELASVITHAIARVASRQGTEGASKADAVNISSVPLIFLGGPMALTFMEPENQILVPFLGFSRENVTEADYLGLQYLYTTGYDPAAAFRFLERLQARGTTSTISQMFRTHPPASDRIEAIKKAIDLILPARESHVLTTPEFDSIKQRLADIQ